jgi:hypothetical protein
MYICLVLLLIHLTEVLNLQLLKHTAVTLVLGLVVGHLVVLDLVVVLQVAVVEEEVVVVGNKDLAEIVRG